MEFEPPNGVDAGSEPKYGRTASNGALERLESRFGAVFHLALVPDRGAAFQGGHARFRAGFPEA